MVHDIVISSKVFQAGILDTEHKKMIFIDLLRSILHNGFITVYEENWMHNIDEALSEHEDSSFSSHVRVLVNSLSARGLIIDSEKKTNTDEELLTSMTDNHMDHDLILCEQRISKVRNVVTISDLFDHALWGSEDLRNTSKFLFMDRGRYTEALRKVLKHAERVHLVDPYFTLQNPSTKDKYRELLELCLELVPQEKIVEIFIHTSTKYPSSEQYWKDEIAALNLHTKAKFYLRIWVPSNRERFHDRYIMTEQFAISLPGGLSTHNEYRRTVWSLLSYQARTDVGAVFDFNDPDVSGMSSVLALQHRYTL